MHDHDHDHGHSHDHHHHPHHHHDHDGDRGRRLFRERPTLRPRSFAERSFTVGIGGPVGSGKTALVLSLCRMLRDTVSLGVVTNDIFTREDAEFLHRHEALPPAQIRAVETGGCPHAAIREDISPNLDALHELMRDVSPELLVVESGGDNLAAHVGASLEVMTRDAARVRHGAPVVLARANVGEGVDSIIEHILAAIP